MYIYVDMWMHLCCIYIHFRNAQFTLRLSFATYLTSNKRICFLGLKMALNEIFKENKFSIGYHALNDKLTLKQSHSGCVRAQVRGARY